MTQFVPRWYQIEAHDALFHYFYNNSGNPLVALPTGAGKSGTIGMFLQSVFATYPQSKVLVLTHVKELVTGDFRALMRIWPNAPAGIHSAGLGKRDIHHPIIFGSVQTVNKIIEAFGHVDLLIVDEAHLIGDGDSTSYIKTISALRRRNPHLKVIGLSATCWRTGMGLLTNGPIFTDICYNLCTVEGFKRLFAEGYLVPPVAKRMGTEYDVSNVRITNGEFAKNELNAVTKNEQVTWAALQESFDKGSDRATKLVFCSGVEHAILTAEMCRALGADAHAVHSKMPDQQRDEIMNAYFAGEFDTLTNNGIATTGIDHPPIDHIIGLRATASVGLFCQMLGRGMRPYDVPGYHKINCLYTDHGGNARRLGTIDDPFIPKLKTKGGGDAPVKICPACDTYNNASTRVCVYCGQPFEICIGYKEKPYEDALVRSDLPIIETFQVNHVFYTSYLKRHATPFDKPCLKADYQCGLQRFTEYVGIESDKTFIAKRARDWWRQRFPHEGFVPSTVTEALHYVDKLVPPKAIKVHVNRKFPEIVGHEY